jgi:purine-binding chemotaxis protein CheW
MAASGTSGWFLSAFGEASRHEPLAGKYVTFRLGPCECGVPLLAVREIVGAVELLPAPAGAAPLRGLLHLPDGALPVVDLGQALGLAQPARAVPAFVLVVDPGRAAHALGVCVDEALEVVDVGAGQIEPAARFADRPVPPLVRGLALVNGRHVLLLDISRLPALTESAVLAA